MQSTNLKAPKWFWAVSILFFLWNLMGVASFILHTFMSAEELERLSAPERSLYDEYPLWVVFLFVIAVIGGLLASVGLLFQKKWSQVAALISLAAVVPQMIHNVYFTSSIQVYGLAQAITMPMLVVVFSSLLVWFTGFALSKNWLK